MDIKQLQYFVTSTDCGSFKKAADLLYTSQPHISKCIKALEEELQVELLRRKARGVELTEAGKEVYSTARRMLKDAEALSALSQSTSRKKLQIGCLANDHLIHVITGYIQNYAPEDTVITYTEGTLQELMNQLNHHHIDIGFVSVNQAMLPAFQQKLESKHLSFYPLQQRQMHLLAGPSSSCYNNTSVSEKELKELRMIRFHGDADFFSQESYIPAAGDTPFRQLDYSLHTNSRQLLVNLLQNTDYCLLDSSIEPGLFGEGRIHTIPVEGKKIFSSFGYIRSSRESLSRSAEELLQYIRQSDLTD
ncbi:MAG: LysR family transcriptional regulator [Lachnospiraceae bacterium]|nr:LysR family transcriptional regulator [Lachnospiraceae bacterium]